MNKKICLLVSLFILFTVMWVSQAEAGWEYQRPITITYTGTALTNYQVRVTLTDFNSTFYDRSAGTTGDDLRFSTDGSGGSEPDVDYWIENWSDGATSTVWIEVPSIPASGNTTVYMYYGNATASAASDGDATFTIFDDFSGGGITPNLTVNVAGSATVTESGGVLRAVCTAAAADGWVFGSMQPNQFWANVEATDTADPNNSASMHILGLLDFASVPSPMASASWNSQNRFMVKRRSPTYAEVPNKFYIQYRTTDVSETYMSWNGTAWATDKTYFGGAGTYEVRVWDDGTNFSADILENGISILSNIATIIKTSVMAYSNGRSLVSTEPYTDYYYTGQNFDNYIIRKYVSPEPSPSVGDETGGDYTLPVELSTFTAQYLDEQAQLYWKTQTETDNLGWNVYRNSESDFTSAIRINDEFIPGHGTTAQPQSYLYKDTNG